MSNLPRVLLAGTHSSVGKTTVTLGLLAALRRMGLSVAPFKAGPDYIDPTLHALAAGRPSRNLDAWLLPAPALRGILRRGTRQGELAVIEGVMGLFDGIGSSQEGSTAAVARTIDSPVVLVLDVAGMSTTAAALVLGCQRMQPGVQLAGVILNRVGSQEHADATAEAIRNATGLPTLGHLPDAPALCMPERHLGLVPASERGLPASTIDGLADLVVQRFDLAGMRAIATSAAWLPNDEPHTPVESGVENASVRIGIAQDRAFGFYYADTFDLLSELGAEVVPFSPLDDERLPESLDGIYLGGGFPELYARQIAANAGMREDLERFARRGAPVYAECGGLMALGRELVTFEGEHFAGFGLLPLVSRMGRERLTIGYREIEAVRTSALLKKGQRVRGHEFHWSLADAPPPALAAYRVLPSGPLEGYCVGSVLGSYVHLSFAADPAPLVRFVQSAARARESASSNTG
ncbi:MAG: cobyrinate a,c-diamide synthase [Chloroflexota bacterium]|nr:cobyrinate a,c-diamide synthase [Chloroflexota bacterium]